MQEKLYIASIVDGRDGSFIVPPVAFSEAEVDKLNRFFEFLEKATIGNVCFQELKK